MFWRPRKTIRLGGVRVNIGKRGVSTSAGHGLGTFSTGQIRWSGNRSRNVYVEESPPTASFGRRVLTSLMVVVAIFVGIGGKQWGWAAGIFVAAIILRNWPSHHGHASNEEGSGVEETTSTEAEEMPQWIRESVPDDMPAWIRESADRETATGKQMAYARTLGIINPELFSRRELSALISEQESKTKSATRESLREIRKLGGILPKADLTEFEAQNALDYLNALDLCCPKCDVPVCVDDRTCLSCRTKLKWEIRIPRESLGGS